MKNKRKKVWTLILVGAAILSMAACGQKDFDTKGYVQAVLDAQYQQKYEDYGKMIGLSEKEAKDQIQGELFDSLEEIKTTGFAITDEQMAEYQQLELEMRSKVNYEVKEAKKDDKDNYTVDVTLTPINTPQIFETTFGAKILEAVETEVPESEYMGILLACEREAIDQTEELEPVTMTLHITYEEKGNEKVYSIKEEDMEKFDSIAIGQE